MSEYSSVVYFCVLFCPTFCQGAPKGRQQKGETGPGTRIFADFCRFSLIFGSLCKSRDLGVADLRRKPQIFAGNRRKPQIFAETGFSHLLSPFWRAPILGEISRTVFSQFVALFAFVEQEGSLHWNLANLSQFSSILVSLRQV